MYLCVYLHISGKTINIGSLNELLADFELYIRNKINNSLLLKPFCFKVLTIFVTHGLHFTNFRRRLVVKQFTGTQLILFDGYRCRVTAWNAVQMNNWSSGCYNVKLALSFLTWLSISSFTFSFEAINCFIKNIRHCTSYILGITHALAWTGM